MLALKKNGGVIQVVGFASYIKPDRPERTEAIMNLREEFGLPTGRNRAGGGVGAGRAPGAVTADATNVARACPVEDNSGAGSAAGGRKPGPRGLADYGVDTLAPEKRDEYYKKLADINARMPAAGRANVSDFVNQIDYAVKLIGIDHVGIASDFDGGGGIDGWNSAAEALNVTLELVRRGYTEEQIGKLWSGNLLRVWGEVEKDSEKLKEQS